jgi:hypothetical protein
MRQIGCGCRAGRLGSADRMGCAGRADWVRVAVAQEVAQRWLVGRRGGLRCARLHQLLLGGFSGRCSLVACISPPSSTLLPFALLDLFVAAASFSFVLFSSPFANRGSRSGTCRGAAVLLGCRAAARAALLGLTPEPYPWTAG